MKKENTICFQAARNKCCDQWKESHRKKNRCNKKYQKLIFRIVGIHGKVNENKKY